VYVHVINHYSHCSTPRGLLFKITMGGKLDVTPRRCILFVARPRCHRHIIIVCVVQYYERKRLRSSWDGSDLVQRFSSDRRSCTHVPCSYTRINTPRNNNATIYSVNSFARCFALLRVRTHVSTHHDITLSTVVLWTDFGRGNQTEIWTLFTRSYDYRMYSLHGSPPAIRATFTTARFARTRRPNSIVA